MGEDYRTVPYKIEKQDDNFVVVKTTDGKVLGKHETRAKANKQLVALRIAESGKKSKLSNNDSGNTPDYIFNLVNDPAVEVTGDTEPARVNGVLHTHKFELNIKVDESGELEFIGKTLEDDTGHTHVIEVMASNPEQTEYQIETNIEDGAEDDHQHLIKIVLDEPLNEPGDEVNESERNDKDIVEASAPNTFHDYADLFIFAEDFDGQRNFQDSQYCFSAPISTTGESEKPGDKYKVKLTEDGYLKHEILRTGTFRKKVQTSKGVVEVELVITRNRLENMARNFSRGITGQHVPFNVHHRPELGAIGYTEKLSLEPNVVRIPNPDGTTSVVAGWSLFGLTALTDDGYELLKNGRYLYTSAEFFNKMRDREVFEGKSRVFDFVLAGSAATITPFISRMRSFAASESDIEKFTEEILKEYPDRQEALKVLKEEMKRRGIY